MKKKIVALCLCIALAVVAIGGATLAYFTDKTDTVTNTFTVGNVDIELAETTGADYTVIPGVPITKDPEVTVKANSATSYVFVKVDKTNWPDTLTYEMGDGWTQLKNDETPAVDVAGVFWREVAQSTSDVKYDVIKNDTINVSKNIENNAFGNDTVTMTFTAYAIQKDTFNTPYAAWTEVSKTANP